MKEQATTTCILITLGRWEHSLTRKSRESLYRKLKSVKDGGKVMQDL